MAGNPNQTGKGQNQKQKSNTTPKRGKTKLVDKRWVIIITLLISLVGGGP
jgi:hypothetical protein